MLNALFWAAVTTIALFCMDVSCDSSGEEPYSWVFSDMLTLLFSLYGLGSRSGELPGMVDRVSVSPFLLL